MCANMHKTGRRSINPPLRSYHLQIFVLHLLGTINNSCSTSGHCWNPILLTSKSSQSSAWNRVVLNLLKHGCQRFVTSCGHSSTSRLDNACGLWCKQVLRQRASGQCFLDPRPLQEVVQLGWRPHRPRPSFRPRSTVVMWIPPLT